MEKYQVKVLSYIGNFKKFIFICPICRENNSIMINDVNASEVVYRCDACRQKYLIDQQPLKQYMKADSQS